MSMTHSLSRAEKWIIIGTSFPWSNRKDILNHKRIQIGTLILRKYCLDTSIKDIKQNSPLHTWSNGHCLRCKFPRHCLHTVWLHARLIGGLFVASNSWQQMGHERNSVHWGAWTGIFTSYQLFAWHMGLTGRQVFEAQHGSGQQPCLSHRHDHLVMAG